MSGRVVAQPQKVNTQQEAPKDSALLQRWDKNQPESTTLPEQLFDGVSDTFTEPRLGYDFSRTPVFTVMGQQTLPSSVNRATGSENAQCTVCHEAAAPIHISEPAEPTVETTPPASEAVPTATPAESITEPGYSETEETPASAEPLTVSAAPGETSGLALIVEDLTIDLAPGQLRKSEFLAQLRTEVTRTAEDALAGTDRTTKDCPYLNYWFGYYTQQKSQHIERAIHRYAPETSSAATANEYIPIIAQRVGGSVEIWARAGEITGIPEGMPMGLPGIGLLGRIGGLVSGIGSIFFKARKGGAKAADNPHKIQSEIGEGQPLEGDIRSRMESAFGMDFAHVRTHTDTTAARLSNRFNARAFTIGQHVAFGSGEYQPGTLVGDALIAHELAHVVQQGSTSASVAPMEMGEDGHALEADADKSAAGAMASLWSGTKETVSGIAENTIPRLRSGLRLQRCSVFSEYPQERYAGYDDSTTPNGLVVPESGSRKIKVRKSSETMKIESDDPSIAGLSSTSTTITVESPGGKKETTEQYMSVIGIKHDQTKIYAKEGDKTVDELDVSVRKRIDKTVDYHYMSDNAGHSTKASPGDEVDLTNTLNLVWRRQANIHFTTGTVDSKQVKKDLGPAIVAPTTASPEWKAITQFATGGAYNVFLVWEFNTAEGADNAEGGTGGKSGDTLLEDNVCDEFTIAHEAGHYLGLYNAGTHPSKGVMGPCGASEIQRVFKAEADKVNP